MKNELAKEAEEKIRNAELLKKIAEDAVRAAAEAEEEAKVAKERAKSSTKIKRTKEKVADKKLVLDYLQKHAWEMMSAENVYDVKFADSPPRIVMVVKTETETPQITHEGINIEVEMEKFIRPEVVKPEETKVVDMSSKDDIYHRSIDGEGAKVLGISEAQGPHSQHTKNKKAYDAWIKRHPIVNKE